MTQRVGIAPGTLAHTASSREEHRITGNQVLGDQPAVYRGVQLEIPGYVAWGLSGDGG